MTPPPQKKLTIESQVLHLKKISKAFISETPKFLFQELIFAAMSENFMIKNHI